MTVSELIKDSSLKAITLPSPDREIKGVYIGDLLSWVMGRAEADSAWITIMSNINVIAVATLADVSCVILAEGVKPDGELIKTAETKGVNLIASPFAAYETAITLSRYLL